MGGAADYVHSNPHRYRKLDPRANKYIFIRYSDESKGYVILGEQPNGTITGIESRDVVFLEGKFPRKGDINDIDRFFLKWTSDKKALLILLRKLKKTCCLVGVYLRVRVYNGSAPLGTLHF